MQKKYNWPLCADVFTWKDKLKISTFLFREKIWTYGKWIRKYEESWEKIWGVKHVVMTSSGSTANELIALRRKWELEQAGEWPKKNKVLFPVNTWISSVTPWIHIGFEPVFVDVTQQNLNVSPTTIRDKLLLDSSIGTVFYTALLGFYDKVEQCKFACEAQNVKFLMDNCEATFTKYMKGGEAEYLMNLATSSTSIFYSHFTTSGTEGGLIATNSDEERDWFVMMRSHGLTRGMPEKYKNPNVHPDFDFALLGSNYRSSNLQAYMASLDLERATYFSNVHRLGLLSCFSLALDNTKYSIILSTDKYGLEYFGYCPLALPILSYTKEQRVKAEQFCKDNGIMTRPIIGGCLLEHTPFKKYGNSSDFPVAKWAHDCGFYIGLNQNVTTKMVEELAKDLNKL